MEIMTTFPQSAYKQRILALAGSADPRESLAQSRDAILSAAERLDDKMEQSYAPGKWTARQILCHLADVEITMGYRLRQILSEDDHRIQPIDENAWASRYGSLDARTAARSFRALREWNLELANSLRDVDLARPAFHPERGPEPAHELLRMWAGHDRNHLAQLEQIA